ncbi:MAG TPA: SusC/RagA family TonB-linked outer membrane protein, partial [Chitinophagaceae bacterium]|nr:SusC/RagA family TonB-linked outer membrane protein [Chitinophagaceae bacterium]
VIASVLVKGTNNGLTTNADGYFELKNVDENAILVISGVSIEQDVEVKVNGRNDIGNIATVTKTVEGTDVVVKTNYWETTQRKNTGNITKITSKDLGKQPVTSLLMALQGRVPGLDIVPNSGVPGTATQIFLRGQNSVRFDGSLPLYVIDGVPIDPRPLFSASNFFDTGIDPFVSLTPDNIASIEVLKDADATAIYGSRGANGVIIITTKKGMRGSQTSVDVGFYKGGGVVPHKIDLLNAKQFLAMRREALANTPRQPNTFDYDLNGVWDTTRSTDWQDVLLGETADITDLRVNFSGSSNTITYKLGGGYHSEGLVYPGDFGFKSMTGYYSMSHHSVNQKFRSSLSVNYGYNKTKTFNNDNIVTLALTLSPVAPSLYDANGELNWQKTPGGASSWTNPLAGSRKTDEVSNSSFLVSSDISYQLLKGLDIKMNTGYTEVNGQQVTKDPLSSRDPNSSSFPNATGESSFGINKRSSWIIEPQLSYRKIFKGHAIEALIGTTFQQSVTQYRRTLGQGYISDELLGSLNGAATTTITEDIDSKYRYAALFARIGYTWKGRYLVNLTGRRDGSSRFAPGKQFGDFGAIGLGWIFTEEAWINKQIPWMSFGKIRFSMGLAGNDQIGDYQFYDTYTPGITPYQGGVTLNPTRLYNPDYAWETTRKIEAAIELGFFEDRVSVGVSWYRHRSDNQLVSVPLPSITGFVAVTDNFDALVENTGWEFAMSATYIQQKNWRWTGSVNFSIPRNKLVRFDNIGQSNFATTFKVGEPLTIRKYYIYTGIDQTTGLHTVKDVDGNGIINSTDQQFGQPFYRRFGGMNNTIGYKNFELSFLIQYVNQNRVRADLFANAPGPTVLNHPVFVLNRWTKPGDVTDVQRFTAATAAVTAYGRYAISDKAVTDASFVRLKTLSLSWSLPATFIKKAKIQQAKLFIQGQNLFTITKYEGLDPESGNTLPPLRILTGGVQLKF